eukprot:symbB.v1.2.020440.t3/scaffold1722.1/size104679/1
MHLCDFGARLDSCTGPGTTVPGCQGPGGTQFSPPRLYGYTQWAVQKFTKQALLDVLPDKEDTINEKVDPGEYGMENFSCRAVCLFLFTLSVMHEIVTCMKMALLLWNVPSSGEKEMAWITHVKDSMVSRVKAKYRVGGMPLHWKAVVFFIVFLPKLALCHYVLLEGTLLLMDTSGIMDSVLGALSMSFVLGLDEMLYNAMTSSAAVSIMLQLEKAVEEEELAQEKRDEAGQQMAHDISWCSWSLIRQIIPVRIVVTMAVMGLYVGRYYEFKCKWSDRCGNWETLKRGKLDEWHLWVSKDMYTPSRASYSLSDFILNGFFQTVGHTDEPFWEPGQVLSSSCELALGLEAGFFAARQSSNESLRMAFYPDIKDSSPVEGQMRYGAHVDSFGLTILNLDPRNPEGLQVCIGDDETNWVDVPFVEDSFVLNVGALLSRWTNGFWKASVHRVLYLPGERLSIVAGALRPRDDVMIEACGPAAGDKRFLPRSGWRFLPCQMGCFGQRCGPREAQEFVPRAAALCLGSWCTLGADVFEGQDFHECHAQHSSSAFVRCSLEQLDHSKPICVPAGKDSVSAIGLPASGQANERAWKDYVQHLFPDPSPSSKGGKRSEMDQAGTIGSLALVDCSPQQPLEALKAQVASATGIRAPEQRLLWGNAEVLASLEELADRTEPKVVELTLLRRPPEQVEWLEHVAQAADLSAAPEIVREDREVLLAAVRVDDDALQWASTDLLADRGVVLEAVRRCGFNLACAKASLQADRGVVLTAVQRHGLALEFAAAEMRRDHEVVLAALLQDGNAFQFADLSLRGDREFVLRAVQQNGYALTYAMPELRGDRDVVMAAIERTGWIWDCGQVEQFGGWALQCAARHLQADLNVVRSAVQHDGAALEFASDDLRADKEVVLLAVQQCGLALAFASPALRENRQVVLAAVSNCGMALEHTSAELCDDFEIVLCAVSRHGSALRCASPRLRAMEKVVMEELFKYPESSIDGMVEQRSEELQQYRRQVQRNQRLASEGIEGNKVAAVSVAA